MIEKYLITFVDKRISLVLFLAVCSPSSITH